MDEQAARALYGAEIDEYGYELVRCVLLNAARIIKRTLEKPGKTPLQAAGAAIRELTADDSGYPRELVESLFSRTGNKSIIRAGGTAEEIYERKNS